VRTLALLLLAPLAFAGPLEESLAQAGANRAELERVLAHYADRPEELAAARFLIENMPGHGYATYGLYDEKHEEIPFDALAYPDFKAAQAALDAIEKEHGPVDFAKKEFVPDLETITADYLIANIDLACAAWRGHPWARAIPFDVFCETILPYRGSNEPLEPWRAAVAERLAPVYAELGNETDAQAAGRAVRKAAGPWIRFRELYYLHPTDQGYLEMARTKTGRCEDITNLMGYAMRASAALCAADYTPAWADRDNNHAWEVVLDANGEGHAPLAHRAAKIYRKTFAIQRDSLGALKREDEVVPGWLRSTHYRDVTPQYLETSDVTLALEGRPEGHRFAYLCVFNGGEWTAIHWAQVGEDGRATFTAMGRGICYLPAWCGADEKLLPAGPPVLLRADGTVTPLPGTGGDVALTANADGPKKVSPDTHEVTPPSFLKEGQIYTLYRWAGKWQEVAKGPATAAPFRFEALPADGLYWLVAEGSRKLERIFTIENGRQRWW